MKITEKTAYTFFIIGVLGIIVSIGTAITSLLTTSLEYNKLMRDIDRLEATSTPNKEFLDPIHYGKPFKYGKHEHLIEVTSLYAKDGNRFLPVFMVNEILNCDKYGGLPCRRFDRTGLWVAGAGPDNSPEVVERRNQYTPPTPLWINDKEEDI